MDDSKHTKPVDGGVRSQAETLGAKPANGRDPAILGAVRSKGRAIPIVSEDVSLRAWSIRCGETER